MSTSAIIAELIEDEENPKGLDIDWDGLDEALDGINERRHGPEAERLRDLGAPPWLYEDFHVPGVHCVSNDKGVCDRCVNPRVGL